MALRTHATENPGSWEFVFDRAALLERAGVDRLVFGEHVVFGEHLGEYRRPELGGRSDGVQPTVPDGYWLEPLTAMSFIAARTTRIRLGTSILLAALRRPVVLAKVAATLDVLSGGRLDLGVGVGWQREEYEAAGLRFEDRGRLLDQTLEVCQTLWRDQVASYKSPDLEFSAIHMMPKPIHPEGVALWISGTVNPRVVSRLVRFGGGWLPWGEAGDSLEAAIPQMKQALADQGRNPDGLPIAANMRIQRHADGELDMLKSLEPLTRLKEIGVTDVSVNLTPHPDESAAFDELSAFVSRFRLLVGRDDQAVT
jgi:probable F420-dependent oxidoreductase